jgi:hypothetical protein
LIHQPLSGGKEMDKMFLDKLMKSQEKEEIQVRNQVGIFYEDGYLAEITTSSGKDPFTTIFSSLRKDTTRQTFTESQIREKCLQIRENVKLGKSDSIELNFIQMIQRFKGNNFDLGNTVIKVTAMDADMPVYLHLRKGDVLSSLVFIGGNDAQAFLLAEDADGKNSAIRLSEFHLLSISENSSPEKEIGLMTSYAWIGAKVYSDVIIGTSLNPVKNLLLSEALKDINTKNQTSEETTDA